MVPPAVAEAQMITLHVPCAGDDHDKRGFRAGSQPRRFDRGVAAPDELAVRIEDGNGHHKPVDRGSRRVPDDASHDETIAVAVVLEGDQFERRALRMADACGSVSRRAPDRCAGSHERHGRTHAEHEERACGRHAHG